MNRRQFFLALLCTLSLVTQGSAEEGPISELTRQYCAECHRGDQSEGDIRFDNLETSVLTDGGRLEAIIAVLTNGAMPPEQSKQPPQPLREKAIASFKTRLLQLDQPSRLKRLTRDEYTNSINDLFEVQFDLRPLLPPDPSGDGFNKWGESQRMSPHHVESYLRTARFVADRLILDERPTQQAWEFGIENFRGTERGDFQTETEHVLTTHYPWRSILYFVSEDDPQSIFQAPEFGRYWIQADAKAHYSPGSETVSLSVGDPRYPTNVEKVARAVLPSDGDSIFFDVTLRAGAQLSFTYDSAATWNTGKKGSEYKGRQVRFTRVRITGPVTETWPTPAQDLIFKGSDFRGLTDENARAFTEHVVDLLLHRSLPESDIDALTKMTQDRLRATGSPSATARTLVTAVLSSPHFFYKHEPETLSGVAFAYRLAYFLWNSIPDAGLLDLAQSGKLESKEVVNGEIERMLADARSDRFCKDFTRQWLSTDKIDDIGPDDRVHDKKRVTFVRVRELAKEPAAFFREILHHDLSMLNFIDSDFAMVNDETAEYYGFGSVSGRKFRRVELPKKSERGGLIGQAGLLKLSCGKHSTSPILRGTWVLRSIYCETLDPPPGVARTGTRHSQQPRRSRKFWRCTSQTKPAIDVTPGSIRSVWHWNITMKWGFTENSIGSSKRRSATKPSRAGKLRSTAPHNFRMDGKIASMSELKAVMMGDCEKILKGILSKLVSYALGREIGIRRRDPDQRHPRSNQRERLLASSRDPRNRRTRIVCKTDRSRRMKTSAGTCWMEPVGRFICVCRFAHL